MSNRALTVRRAQVKADTAEGAAKQLTQQLSCGRGEPAITIFFSSAKFDRSALECALTNYLPGPVFGCTTSGELGPEGYSEHTISAVSLKSEHLIVIPEVVKDLKNFDAGRAKEICAHLRVQIEKARQQLPGSTAFGILLVDGLSVMEEHLMGHLGFFLPDLPIAGGSAGDDLEFQSTAVFANGEFHSNAAVLLIFVTTHPFTVFKSQHFQPTDRKVVITRAEPKTRTVQEINGEPASEEFARLVGCSVADLNPAIFSDFPLLLAIGGDQYVRSIQRVNADKSITFYCAIEEGLVLSMGRPLNMIANLNETIASIRARIGDPKLMVCFECILRRLEVEKHLLTGEIGAIYTQHNAIGFHTYGEQHAALHINQTLTGVAISE